LRGEPNQRGLVAEPPRDLHPNRKTHGRRI